MLQQRDQNKLLKAKFILLRSGSISKEGKDVPVIKYKRCLNFDWRILEEFPSKAARDKGMREFMEHDMYVET